MKLMNEALAIEEGTAHYLSELVDGIGGLNDYLDRIGSDTMARLVRRPTGFLLDPFRRWILPHVDAVALVEEAERS